MEFKLEAFMGMMPRVSPRLLPNTAATLARNTKLLQGELRGFHTPSELADLSAESFTVRRTMKIVDISGALYGDGWLSFDSRDVDIVRSPLVNDAHDRYYWAGDGRPKYSSSYRILQGMTPYYLGIPVPGTAPSISPPAGSTFTRSYVYTFVSSVGEEGPPSSPTVASGDAGTWALSTLTSTVTDSANRSVTHKKIYRTVPGNDSSTYFLVTTIPIAQTTYNDADTDATVVLNSTLESTTWYEPPEDLEGFVAMPGGYLAGWVGRRLVFSEPYRPHAWPPEYELATDFPIVGLAVWGNTLVIGTQSRPYMGQGVNPAAFTLQKMDAVEPCLSRRGMVATVVGAFYPSQNGLVLVNGNGVTVVTKDILTKEEWADYNPEDIFAAQLGLQYIAFTGTDFGFIYDPTEPTSKFVELDEFDAVAGIETDPYTGNVLILSQDKVLTWDPDDTPLGYFRWKSKEFHFPKPVNFGAVQIAFDDASTDVSESADELYGPYNEDRLAAASLGELGGHCLCGPAQDTGLVSGWTLPETMQPLGGGSLYDLSGYSFSPASVRLIVYCGSRGVIFDSTLDAERLLRLPSGFKSDLWQFELIGNTPVYSIKVAETPRGLQKV